MSDDTSELIDRLRDHENEGVTGSDRFHLRNEAADTVERLERDRDALAERADWLHLALRDHVIGASYLDGDNLMDHVTKFMCVHCDSVWEPGGPERHAEGCLAAPKDAP